MQNFAIVVAGVSSSGKTSAVRAMPARFQKIYIDDIIEAAHRRHHLLVDHDRYYEDEEMHRVVESTCNQIILERIDAPLVAIDYVLDVNGYVSLLLPHAIKVLLYVDPQTLCQRMISREMTEPRGVWLFEQFANAFHKTVLKDARLDTVSLPVFIEALKTHAKSYFAEEETLERFARHFFAQMGIFDQEEHWIGARYRKEFDHILIVGQRTPEQIAEKLTMLFVNKFTQE